MSIAFDTLGSTALINENLPKGLETQAMLELGVDRWGKRSIIFGDKKKAPSPMKEMGDYCGLDTAYTHMLYEVHREKLLAEPDLVKLYKLLILPGLEALLDMEINGVYLVEENVNTQEKVAKESMAAIEKKLLEMISEDFQESASFSNPYFLRKWLFTIPKPDGLELTPTKFTDKGLPSTDEESLRDQTHPAAKLLLEWRGYEKRLQYLEQWKFWRADDNRVHPYFNMFGPVTGRRSCQKPNLQQVSREGDMRSCFGAPPGYVFLEADFSQVEVRIAAWIAREETLLRIFHEERDPYRIYGGYVLGKPETAVSKEERQKAKIAVLGFLYGMGVQKFVKYAKVQYNVTFTEEEAKDFRNGYFNLFSGLRTYHEESRQRVRKKLAVQSAFGRIRHLPQVLSRDNYVSGGAERQAINFPIQSFGGDLTLSALVELHELTKPFRDEIKIVGDIHDALLFEIREDVWKKWAEVIFTTMESPSLLKRFGISLDVPIKVEGKIGTTWGSKNEFTLEMLRNEQVQLH